MTRLWQPGAKVGGDSEWYIRKANRYGRAEWGVVALLFVVKEGLVLHVAISR